MLQVLLHRCAGPLSRLARSFLRFPVDVAAPVPARPAGPVPLGPLERVTLTDDVSRTMFDEYAHHHAGKRGEEETGWVLLGLREDREAVVLATLPAGSLRDAGTGHVQFNSAAQALGSRIVRQADRRITIVGVVHTHPGSLRHPSDGDFRGDSRWVGRLRGGEGVFGIGTADHAANGHSGLFASQPRPNVQALGKYRLTWYALGHGEGTYRPLPVGLTLGPDLARPLHGVWSVIEAHADRLDRLCRQQAGVTFEVARGKKGQALVIHIPLAEPKTAIQILLEGEEADYYVLRDGEALQVDPHESRVDRAVYLLLAELAAREGE